MHRGLVEAHHPVDSRTINLVPFLSCWYAMNCMVQFYCVVMFYICHYYHGRENSYSVLVLMLVYILENFRYKVMFLSL